MTRVLWFHPRALLPVRGGGEVRVSGLVDAVVRAGHEVLVVQPGPLSTTSPDSFRILEVPVRRGLALAASKVLSSSPLRTARLTRQGRRTARHEIAVFAPDVAVVSELLSWPVAESLLPDIPWVFDAHNVETELFREMAGHASGVFDRVALGVDHRRVARQEKVLVRAADAVVAVSQDDADTLEKLGPLRTPVVVPSSVPMPVSPGPPAAEPVVLFVGTLDFPPNVEAVTELVTRVMPLVREQLPDAVVRVVGRNPTPAVRSLLARTSWVTFTEDAPSVEGHYRSARCVILPIRSGGGSRLKVYEALSYAVPIIGTSRAFSGIPVGDHAVILGETEDELAAGALRVLSDDEVAAKVGMAARALFVDRLSWEHAAVPLLDLIAELTARR